MDQGNYQAVGTEGRFVPAGGELRVSDFKVAQSILRSLSQTLGLPFVDASLKIEGADSWGSHDGSSIVIPKTASLGQTILAIVAHYVDSIDLVVGRETGISDEEKEEFNVTAATVIRDLIYAPSSAPPETPSKRSLSSFPVAWLLLRNVIAPYYGAMVKDIPVVLQHSALRDIAVASKTGFDDQSVIYVNRGVAAGPVREAFLAAAAMKAMGVDPKLVMSGIVQDDFLAGKCEQFASLAYASKDNPTQDQAFLRALAEAAGLSSDEIEQTIPQAHAQVLAMVKNAQSASRTGGQQEYEGVAVGLGGGAWMVPTLTEGMMDTVRNRPRGENPVLKGLRDAIWNRVSTEKARLGKTDMSLEDLLRAKSLGMKAARGATLQSLLSEQRIW